MGLENAIKVEGGKPLMRQPDAINILIVWPARFESAVTIEAVTMTEPQVVELPRVRVHMGRRYEWQERQTVTLCGLVPGGE